MKIEFKNQFSQFEPDPLEQRIDPIEHFQVCSSLLSFRCVHIR